MTIKIVSSIKKSFLGEYTKNLFQLMPKKVTLALCLMVLISLIQGISLILLVPLLQLVGLNVGQGSLGQIASLISTIFMTLGLQLNLLNVLVLYVAVMSLSAILTRFQTLRTSDIEFQFAEKSCLCKRIAGPPSYSGNQHLLGLAATLYSVYV